jgi:hypothetical protein
VRDFTIEGAENTEKKKDWEGKEAMWRKFSCPIGDGAVSGDLDIGPSGAQSMAQESAIYEVNQESGGKEQQRHGEDVALGERYAGNLCVFRHPECERIKQ